MAQCVRYEIILPLQYRPTDQRKSISIPPADYDSFFRRIVARYGGCTATNPYSPSPYLGIWKGQAENVLTAFVLVPSRNVRQAQNDFTRWKDQLEKKYNQKLILIFHHNVNTIGEL